VRDVDLAPEAVAGSAAIRRMEVLLSAVVTAVSASARHTFSKRVEPRIRLLTGLGVSGDVHAGVTVQQRYARSKHRQAPNLRQVHLLDEELFNELRSAGFDVGPGMLGENITTRGIALASMPAGARVRLGSRAIVELTGLREPCRQIDTFAPSLFRMMRASQKPNVRMPGVMAIVVAGGDVSSGDTITVDIPTGKSLPLAPI
jgi:MOSC domain-containing protein YiiM